MKKTKYKTRANTPGTIKRRDRFKSETTTTPSPSLQQQSFFKAPKKYFGGP